MGLHIGRRINRLRWLFSSKLDAIGVKNRLLRYMLIHWAIGIGIGVFCATAFLLINPIGFRDLLLRSDAMIPALILLYGGFSVTFGGVVCATAVMFPYEEDKRGSRTPVTPNTGLAAVRVKS